MGNYASYTDLQDRFEDTALLEQLTDVEIGDGVDTDVLDDCIEDSEGRINSYLGVLYDTPIDVSGNAERARFLKRLTLDIAQYFLVGGRADFASEEKKALYESAIELLKMIAAGKAAIPGGEVPDGSDSAAAIFQWGSNDASETSMRVFTRDSQRAL